MKWCVAILVIRNTHHWKCQLAKKKELLIPPIWGCCGPTGGSIFTPGQKNHPAFFEGRWYTGKMARQIWAEWAVCLSSYLWKGWMVFLPRGKNWTSSRSTTTPDRWYWKFFFFGQLVLPMMCAIKVAFSIKDFWDHSPLLPPLSPLTPWPRPNFMLECLFL